MKPSSFQLLRLFSFLIFVLAVANFILANLIDWAPTTGLVRDAEHKIIGKASIPHNYFPDSEVTFFFLALSGVQYWTVRVVGKLIEKQSS